MLEGKVAIVTGGTRGIGLETVRVFKENKAEVVLLGSKKDSVDKAISTLKEEGFEVTGYYPNLNDPEEVKKTVAEINEKFGHIDILINNAGLSAKEPIGNTTYEDFTKLMDININAMFNMSKEVIPYLEKNGGVILNTSSMVSIYGQPAGIAYPTSKFAVNGFTKSLARELASKNIRVNAVAPGVTRTDMLAALPEETIAPIIKTIPLGRIGEPRDIANAFLFLASDMASYITGVILSVDGAART